MTTIQGYTDSADEAAKWEDPISEGSEQWTQRDTEICERAEKSGLSISLKTGEPLTFEELDELALEYDKVRHNISVDEFFKTRVGSRPLDV